MPGSNQGGGGRGPWDQGPGGGGPQPPNLEELLKRGQDRLKRFTPGGFGGIAGISIVALVVIGAWLLMSSPYRVQPDEQGVVLRFGKYARTTGPGFHLKLPAPLEEVLLPKVTRENQVQIGITGFRTWSRSTSGRWSPTAITSMPALTPPYSATAPLPTSPRVCAAPWS